MAYNAYSAADNTGAFAEGISGLSEAAKHHMQTIHNMPDCERPTKPKYPSGNEDARYVMDPSGYVYEAVASNRVEGVTATAYYKEMVEDMYGDLHENIVKWDAEEYAQQNPLFTDEYGMYAWDVPQGLWQVKFEKEGYETTYSEWLPVPPPQLDINIAMRQNIQPTVKHARAFESAVELEFDKYMEPALLIPGNIRVMTGGKEVEGTVELLNEEATGEGYTLGSGITSPTFASRLRFNATKPFDANKVTLIVSNRVKSYAGVTMQNDYEQEFNVQLEVRSIDCDETVTVGYGSDASFTVSVKPAAAAAGRTLTIQSSSPQILSTEASSIVLDSEGKAVVTVNGELPGMAALTFAVEGYDVKATTVVSVNNYKLGDVNHDYVINVADIANIIDMMAGCECFIAGEADVNGDGAIDVADIAAIISIMAGE